MELINILTFIEDKYRLTAVIFLENKNESHLQKKLVEKIKIFIADNVPKFLSQESSKFLGQKGILRRFTSS